MFWVHPCSQKVTFFARFNWISLQPTKSVRLKFLQTAIIFFLSVRLLIINTQNFGKERNVFISQHSDIPEPQTVQNTIDM